MPVNVKDDVARQDLAEHKKGVGTVHPEFVKKDSQEYVDETPTGAMDSVNKTYTISAPVVPETLLFTDTEFPWLLFRVSSDPGEGEFAYDGNVTLTTGHAPAAGHRLHVKATKAHQKGGVST